MREEGRGGFTQKVHQSRNFVIDSSHPAEPVSPQSQKEKSFINQVPSKYSPHPTQIPADLKFKKSVIRRERLKKLFGGNGEAVGVSSKK